LGGEHRRVDIRVESGRGATGARGQAAVSARSQRDERDADPRTPARVNVRASPRSGPAPHHEPIDCAIQPSVAAGMNTDSASGPIASAVTGAAAFSTSWAKPNTPTNVTVTSAQNHGLPRSSSGAVSAATNSTVATAKQTADTAVDMTMAACLRCVSTYVP
jgi:hypothetical protein